MQVAEIKPRIRKIGLMWVCYTDFDTIPALGFSVEEAFFKWLAINQ